MCTYDIYLAGTPETEWRAEFKKKISPELKVFDPLSDECGHSHSSCPDEQLAKEYCSIKDSNIIVFCFDGYSPIYGPLIEFGECVGANKQVVVYSGRIDRPSYFAIKSYCEYRGVLLVNSMDELVETAQDCAMQVHACQVA